MAGNINKLTRHIMDRIKDSTKDWLSINNEKLNIFMYDMPRDTKDKRYTDLPYAVVKVIKVNYDINKGSTAIVSTIIGISEKDMPTGASVPSQTNIPTDQLQIRPQEQLYSIQELIVDNFFAHPARGDSEFSFNFDSEVVSYIEQQLPASQMYINSVWNIPSPIVSNEQFNDLIGFDIL